MNKYKWGVIGTGKIAHTFATALMNCENAELCASASRTEEKAKRFAEEFGFLKYYGSYREFAEKSDAEIVYIATPMASHFDDAWLCLENGKNVLCEKSLALNTAQTEKLIAFAKEKGLFFMEAMWMKCRPVYRKMKEWIASGLIGDIEYIKADFSNFIPYDENDRLFRADCGGGCLLDLGIYPITLTHDLLGVPDDITSSAHIMHGIDMSNSILFRYKNGAFSSMDNGFEIQLRNNAIISGTKGFITLGNWFHCTEEGILFDRNGKEIERFVRKDDINGYEYEIAELHSCLDVGLKESPLVPHSDTIAVMKLMDECRAQWGMKYPNE
ncbi:MAG: Gfo/Idh/MocA family oxidoreductase [Ruminococcus sp.]|uniref:Gfo/Idh/MocA family protein n=1 Tax=Ruminococcus sp. TaxID=41978 RepID=UPI001B2B21C9|nr:Gfo/Idh/MocA family oxidoreductase [Ruminococcus sp.]MBO7472886.1 Gfo/Idh/MocA family oxidoreductase [Ruminococcus sp.]